MAGAIGLPTLRRVLSRLQLRLTLFAVGITGLTVLLAGFATIGLYARQNLTLIAQTASYSVAPAIIFNDPEAARLSIEPLVTGHGVADIDVITAGGGQFVQWRNPDDHGDGPVELLAERLFFPERIEVPIVHNGDAIGRVRVRGDAGVIAGYIRAGLLGTLACLLVAAIATYLLAARLRRSIIEPLQAIAGVAHAVRADREFDRRAPPAKILEVEALRSDFNALLSELEEWHHHLRREHAELNHLANHDMLTGLPNRAHFEQQFTEMLDQAGDGGDGFAILYADGDRFKAVNDSFGHAAGDAVLVEIARRLADCLRPRDIAARVGGDEFAVLLAAPCSAEDVQRMRRRLAVAMAEPIALPSGDSVTVDLSIGAGRYPADGGDLAALINHADAEMYMAKNGQLQVKTGKGSA